mmetsp:Transcript_34101/g.78794  ORF Transcript_34101/g.78794 Transcript_34101/m.78794 type:complete len:278 (+) Transcript_34101:408-1241(+)
MTPAHERVGAVTLVLPPPPPPLPCAQPWWRPAPPQPQTAPLRCVRPRRRPSPSPPAAQRQAAPLLRAAWPCWRQRPPAPPGASPPRPPRAGLLLDALTYEKLRDWASVAGPLALSPLVRSPRRPLVLTRPRACSDIPCGARRRPASQRATTAMPCFHSRRAERARKPLGFSASQPRALWAHSLRWTAQARDFDFDLANPAWSRQSPLYRPAWPPRTIPPPLALLLSPLVRVPYALDQTCPDWKLPTTPALEPRPLTRSRYASDHSCSDWSSTDAWWA